MDDAQSFINAQIIKGGMFYETAKLNIETNKLKVLQPVDGFDIRFSSYEHRWNCGPFNCASWYNVNAFILNSSGGKERVNVETAIAIQDQPPVDWDPKLGLYYKHFENVTDFYIGCGQVDGHDPDFWGVAKVYFSNGAIIAWRWTSHA